MAMAVAKRDIQVLMEDGRFSDFKEGRPYHFVNRQDGSVVLMDEKKCGYICDTAEEFNQDFKVVEEGELIQSQGGTS